jgi:hypothetical protein
MAYSQVFLHDRAAASRAARTGMLRVFSAVIATLELMYFYAEMPFPFSRMLDLNARWFNILSGLCVAVVAPLLAVAAPTLAAMGRRLGLAAILLGVAPVVYWSPVIGFFIGRMIYGS